jgi:hypothetical protein
MSAFWHLSGPALAIGCSGCDGYAMALQVTVPGPPTRGTLALRKSVDKLTPAELDGLRQAFVGACS